ncbi:hypothetical protein PISMIDRAFT_445561 [Pisolithus microcarpus 441]|uniref:Uncharacterized protein n=1 Tax=Pisolithus microcarpus 441 TaxID=765257 RepID=A0A0D0A616_9AGAM|nr:hypothetical protein PISMIDRAFT_445561 [Pisolithus microcarpus 441]
MGHPECIFHAALSYRVTTESFLNTGSVFQVLYLSCVDTSASIRVGLGAKLELECTILPKLVAVVTSPTYQCCERVRINGSPHVGRLITMKWYTRVPV